jgi:hypothetical protein
MTETYLIRGRLTDPRITQASLILFKIVCAAPHHVALLTSAALLNLGPSPVARVSTSKGGSGAADAEPGQAVASVKWVRQGG